MSDSAMGAMSFDSGDEQPDADKPTGQDTTPGGQREVKWKVVAQAPGITPATIIANRLQAEGLPVRAWQEGAGQALGLTVGKLGTGFVAVPEEYEEQARRILESDEEEFGSE